MTYMTLPLNLINFAMPKRYGDEYYGIGVHYIGAVIKIFCKLGRTPLKFTLQIHPKMTKS